MQAKKNYLKMKLHQQMKVLKVKKMKKKWHRRNRNHNPYEHHFAKLHFILIIQDDESESSDVSWDQSDDESSDDSLDMDAPNDELYKKFLK